MRESKNVLSLRKPCRDTPPGVSPYFPVRSAATPGGVALQGYLWLPWRGSAHRFPRGWCSAQRIQNPMIAGGNHTTIPSCHGVALKSHPMTDEECGRLSESQHNISDILSGWMQDRTMAKVLKYLKQEHCRPHSSSVRKSVSKSRFPDSFPPGEAMGAAAP